MELRNGKCEWNHLALFPILGGGKETEGLLTRPTDKTELQIFNLFQISPVSISQLPSFYSDPSQSSGGRPSQTFSFFLKTKPKPGSLSSDLKPRPLTLAFGAAPGERKPQEEGRGERVGDAFAGGAAATAASTAAPAWCILLPPSPPSSRGRPTQAPSLGRAPTAPASSPGPLPHEGSSPPCCNRRLEEAGRWRPGKDDPVRAAPAEATEAAAHVSQLLEPARGGTGNAAA